MTQKNIRLRRGLTLHDRQKLRGMVYRREAARAARRASQWGLSAECISGLGESLHGDPAKAAALHASCTAEEIGGKGCLCPHHDVIPEGVVSKTIEQALYD